MSRVILTQPNIYRDRATGAMRPKFDLSHAAAYGELVVLLEDSQLGASSDMAQIMIERRLEEIGFDPDSDFLLISGDKELGAAVAVIMDRMGGARMLRWDGKHRRYSIMAMKERCDER